MDASNQPRLIKIAFLASLCASVLFAVGYAVAQLSTNLPSSTTRAVATDPTLSTYSDGVSLQPPTWEQDFSTMPNGPVNSSIWRFEDNPDVPTWNNENQVYTSRLNNVRIEDGNLVIETHRETVAYPGASRTYDYSSGRIDTLQSFHFSYGRIDITAKFSSGQGPWGALWLLSASEPYTDEATEAQWLLENDFYLKNGEIDIAEHYGKKEVVATLHTHTFTEERFVGVPDVSEAFHTYSVEITPDGVTWSLDDTAYFMVEKKQGDENVWPFTDLNSYYLIVNLAMGGSSGGEIDPNLRSAQMQIKTIKFTGYHQQ